MDERSNEGGATASRRPSIRQLTLLAGVVVALLATLDVAGLVWASGRLERATELFARHSASREVTWELERALMEYQRLSDLALLTREPAVRVARSDIEGRVLSLAERAMRYADSARERRLLLELSRHVGGYVREREQLHSAGLAAEAIVRRGTPALDRTLEDLRALRDLNEAQVTAAQRAAVQAQRRSSWIEYLSLALLCAGLVVAVVTVRRYLVGPVLQLSRSIAGFRGGELAPRAREEGTKETVELVRAFNDMMELLARQRSLQLAFLGGVAHDLRNPVAALAMGLEVIRHEPDEAARAEVIARLERQMQRLQRMIGDFLDAARIEAGQLDLQKDRFDLAGVVAGVVELHAAMATEHRVELRRPAEPLFVEADPLRIEQVAANLVSNAIKYSPEGGPVEVSLEAAGDEVVLEVADHGIGMTPEETAEVFMPFRRHASDVAPGAGLGLSVVRRIVNAHRGRIEVESTKEEGTTFRVRLRRAAQGARRETDRRPSEAAARVAG